MSRSDKLASLAVKVSRTRQDAATARARWLAAKPEADANAETAYELASEGYLKALEAYFALAERVRLSDRPPA
jgi:hypothetical protein